MCNISPHSVQTDSCVTLAGNDYAVRCRAIHETCCFGGTIVEGLSGDRYDAEGVVRFFEASVRGQVGCEACSEHYCSDQ